MHTYQKYRKQEIPGSFDQTSSNTFAIASSCSYVGLPNDVAPDEITKS